VNKFALLSDFNGGVPSQNPNAQFTGIASNMTDLCVELMTAASIQNSITKKSGHSLTQEEIEQRRLNQIEEAIK
jgi:hypothetical protein